ncbi:MAG: vancomycin high temperature exclusion protein [Candidatus Methylacidiphilales bacterium]|nr:ElyC/SanA/YdcF family protein [Candidatus Methylacidiphilales bacterium]
MLRKLSSWKWIKRGLIALGTGIALACLFVVICNVWIRETAAPRVVYELDKVPYNEVGMVLGTAPNLRDGRPNKYFRNRVEAAARLYHAGKVKRLLLSGDNSRPDYNEPDQMRRSLLELNVPPIAMEMDGAGLRTLDSVLRARDEFHTTKFTIITDDFHTYRSVFTALKHGMDVVAYPSEEVPPASSMRTRFREYMANSWAILDIYVFNTGPRVPGKRDQTAVPPVAAGTVDSSLSETSVRQQ